MQFQPLYPLNIQDESLEGFYELVESMPLCLIVTDPEGKVLDSMQMELLHQSILLLKILRV